MAVAGVIAEYNPFHRGHAWQLGEIRRRLGADTPVVVCMSGNFVQRGDLAVLNKFARAETALRGGADLVLELPAQWCGASELFARGGVAILTATGVVTHLAFGCECGALEPLETVASCIASGVYCGGLRRSLKKGTSFMTAFQAAVRLQTGAAADCLNGPNNTLAVAYLLALRQQGSPLIPLALPRVGGAHDSEALGEYPSASAIRRLLLAGEDWRPYVPETTANLLNREIAAGRAPAALQNCERAVLFKLRTMSEEDFRPYDGGGEGLYHRFYDAVRAGSSIDGILSAVKTRRYPLSRLRRMLLQSWLSLPPAGKGEAPRYLRVLGATERGRALLARMRTAAALPVITKPAHVRSMGEDVRAAFDREARYTDLYTLAYPALEQARPDSDYQASPVML